MRTRELLAGLALALVAPCVAAQAPEAPKHTCNKPDFPGRLAPDGQKRTFEKRAKEFEACMKAFIEERNALIKSSEVQARAAIEEYNVWLNTVREQQGMEPVKPQTPSGSSGASGGKTY